MPRWVSTYDFPKRSCEIVRAEEPGPHWCGLELDASTSDPDGRFQVFRNEHGEIIRVAIALDEAGDLAARHQDFDDAVIGSLTIWPAGMTGGLAPIFTWWSDREIWTKTEPGPWQGP